MENSQWVPIESLLPADSPRIDGEDAEHTRLLADSGVKLPPIIVHRPTMRIINGMHRLGAAVLRGDESIEVRFFDGPEDEAFILAVQANIAHGRPLSLADRTRGGADRQDARRLVGPRDRGRCRPRRANGGRDPAPGGGGRRCHSGEPRAYRP